MIEKILTQKQIESFSKKRNEPHFILDKRLNSFSSFEKINGTDFPVYFNDINFNKLNIENEIIDSNEIHFHLTNENLQLSSLTLLNGKFFEQTSSDEFKNSKIILCDTNTAIKNFPNLIEKYFSKNIPINEDKLVALNSSMFDGGNFLYVPKNTNLVLPLQTLNQFNNSNSLLNPRNLIIVEEQSSLTFVEYLFSSENVINTFINSTTELFVGESSKLNYLSLQELNLHTNYKNFKRAILKKDSAISWVEVSFGGKNSFQHIETYLEGTRSDAEIIGIYFTENSQQMGFKTLQKHISPHTSSNLLFKGILKDNSKTFYEGLIKVHKGAQKTNAYQKNQNILLSENANADSLPELEIEADDVKCTHGATVGPINQEDLFYLQTRGLNKHDAIHLLTIGFLKEAIDKISVQSVKDEVLNFIEKRLE